jgi:CBS domain-containing protein
MSSPAVTVKEETPVMEVADLFTRRGINRVPVVDSNGRMVGIVSRGDVVRSSCFGGGA